MFLFNFMSPKFFFPFSFAKKKKENERFFALCFFWREKKEIGKNLMFEEKELCACFIHIQMRITRKV